MVELTLAQFDARYGLQANRCEGAELTSQNDAEEGWFPEIAARAG